MRKKAIEIFIGIVIIALVVNTVIQFHTRITPEIFNNSNLDYAKVFSITKSSNRYDIEKENLSFEHYSINDFQFNNIRPKLDVYRIDKIHTKKYLTILDKYMEKNDFTFKRYQIGGYLYGIGEESDSSIFTLFGYPFDNSSSVIIESIIPQSEIIDLLSSENSGSSYDGPQVLGDEFKFTNYYQYNTGNASIENYIYTYNGTESDIYYSLDSYLYGDNWMSTGNEQQSFPGKLYKKENCNMLVTINSLSNNEYTINCSIIEDKRYE